MPFLIVYVRGHGLRLLDGLLPAAGAAQTIRQVLGLTGGYMSAVQEWQEPPGATHAWVARVEGEEGGLPAMGFAVRDGARAEAEVRAELADAGLEVHQLERVPITRVRH